MTVALSGGCFQNRLLLEHGAARAGRGGLPRPGAPPGALQRRRLSLGQAVVTGRVPGVRWPSLM